MPIPHDAISFLEKLKELTVYAKRDGIAKKLPLNSSNARNLLALQEVLRNLGDKYDYEILKSQVKWPQVKAAIEECVALTSQESGYFLEKTSSDTLAYLCQLGEFVLEPRVAASLIVNVLKYLKHSVNLTGGLRAVMRDEKLQPLPHHPLDTDVKSKNIPVNYYLKIFRFYRDQLQESIPKLKALQDQGISSADLDIKAVIQEATKATITNTVMLRWVGAYNALYQLSVSGLQDVERSRYLTDVTHAAGALADLSTEHPDLALEALTSLHKLALDNQLISPQRDLESALQRVNSNQSIIARFWQTIGTVTADIKAVEHIENKIEKIVKDKKPEARFEFLVGMLKQARGVRLETGSSWVEYSTEWQQFFTGKIERAAFIAELEEAKVTKLPYPIENIVHMLIVKQCLQLLQGSEIPRDSSVLLLKLLSENCHRDCFAAAALIDGARKEIISQVSVGQSATKAAIEGVVNGAIQTAFGDITVADTDIDLKAVDEAIAQLKKIGTEQECAYYVTEVLVEQLNTIVKHYTDLTKLPSPRLGMLVWEMFERGGYNFEVRTQAGWSIVTLAVHYGFTQFLELYVKQGLDTSIKTRNGSYPLRRLSVKLLDEKSGDKQELATATISLCLTGAKELIPMLQQVFDDELPKTNTQQYLLLRQLMAKACLPIAQDSKIRTSQERLAIARLAVQYCDETLITDFDSEISKLEVALAKEEQQLAGRRDDAAILASIETPVVPVKKVVDQPTFAQRKASFLEQVIDAVNNPSKNLPARTRQIERSYQQLCLSKDQKDVLKEAVTEAFAAALRTVAEKKFDRAAEMTDAVLCQLWDLKVSVGADVSAEAMSRLPDITVSLGYPQLLTAYVISGHSTLVKDDTDSYPIAKIQNTPAAGELIGLCIQGAGLEAIQMLTEVLQAPRVVNAQVVAQIANASYLVLCAADESITTQTQLKLAELAVQYATDPSKSGLQALVEQLKAAAAAPTAPLAAFHEDDASTDVPVVRPFIPTAPPSVSESRPIVPPELVRPAAEPEPARRGDAPQEGDPRAQDYRPPAYVPGTAMIDRKLVVSKSQAQLIIEKLPVLDTKTNYRDNKNRGRQQKKQDALQVCVEGILKTKDAKTVQDLVSHFLRTDSPLRQAGSWSRFYIQERDKTGNQILKQTSETATMLKMFGTLQTMRLVAENTKMSKLEKIKQIQQIFINDPSAKQRREKKWYQFFDAPNETSQLFQIPKCGKNASPEKQEAAVVAAFDRGYIRLIAKMQDVVRRLGGDPKTIINNLTSISNNQPVSSIASSMLLD